MYKKRPKKSELYAMVEQLEKENQKLAAEAEAAEREKWEQQKPLAHRAFWEQINPRFGATLCNVRLEHVDKSGFWFSFSLINDNRQQTYCVRHSDIA